jgi:hypothetical protein
MGPQGCGRRSKKPSLFVDVVSDVSADDGCNKELMIKNGRGGERGKGREKQWAKLTVPGHLRQS